jgi:hypothetical protein
VRGVLAVPAVAGAVLTVSGTVEIGGPFGFSVGGEIDVSGSAEMQAYATAEPHIGRTRRDDGSARYFIRGLLTAGAVLFLGLRGSLAIKTPRYVPNILIVDFGHYRWRIGSATVRSSLAFFLGEDKEPELKYKIGKDFDPSALVKSLLSGKLPTGEAEAQKQTEHWVDGVETQELEPVRATPALPVGEEAVDVETPTLAQHQLPAFTEVEESANAPIPGRPTPAATPAQPVPLASPGTQTLPNLPAPATLPATAGGPTTPARATSAPTGSVPQALVVTFSMQTAKHALFLRAEDVPEIWMESVTRRRLEPRILDAIAIAQGELDDARSSGVSASGRSV